MKLNTKLNLNLKLKFDGPINVGLAAKIVLALVILFELYLAYTYLFRNLNPAPPPVVGDAIVRVDRAALSTATKFFDDEYNFTAPAADLANPNPFQYSP